MVPWAHIQNVIKIHPKVAIIRIFQEGHVYCQSAKRKLCSSSHQLQVGVSLSLSAKAGLQSNLLLELLKYKHKIIRFGWVEIEHPHFLLEMLCIDFPLCKVCYLRKKMFMLCLFWCAKIIKKKFLNVSLSYYYYTISWLRLLQAVVHNWLILIKMELVNASGVIIINWIIQYNKLW